MIIKLYFFTCFLRVVFEGCAESSCLFESLLKNAPVREVCHYSAYASFRFRYKHYVKRVLQVLQISYICFEQTLLASSIRTDTTSPDMLISISQRLSMDSISNNRTILKQTDGYINN